MNQELKFKVISSMLWKLMERGDTSSTIYCTNSLSTTSSTRRLWDNSTNNNIHHYS